MSLSNVHPGKEIRLTVEMNGAAVKKVNKGEILMAPKYNSVNTFDNPQQVKPGEFKGYKVTGTNTLEVTLPPHSVVTLEME